MLKFETQAFLQNKISSKMHSDGSKDRDNFVEKSPLQIIQNLRQKKILFVREHLNSSQNFHIQKEEQQEVIYLKPDCTDAVMSELTKIAISEDNSEIESIEYHIRAAQLLDYYTANQIQVQYTSVLFSKINYALALKKYGLTDNVIDLLMECDQILKIKGKTLKKVQTTQQNESVQQAKIIQNKLLRLRILFQCTLLFSESRRNKQALELAKGVLNMLKAIFSNTIQLCQQMNFSSLINKKQRANSEISSPQVHTNTNQLQYTQIVETVFKEISQLIRCVLPASNTSEDKYQENLIIRSQQSRSQSVDKYSEILQLANSQQNKLYPNIEDNHPMLQMQILGLMQMNSVDLEELYPINQCEMVIAEEVILELIMLTGLCFYSISTEMRFINQNQQTINHFDNRQTLEIWLCKSLEIFYTYVPHSSQIFNQIYQVYKKLYGVEKQMIPEDQEITHTTKLLRPHAFNNKASLANKIVIVIKVPQAQIPSVSKHAQTTQKTNPSSNKNSKKYLVASKRHLLTQVDSEDQEETERSPNKLFIKNNNQPFQKYQPIEIRMRVESLMNSILNQQAKLQSDKQRIKSTATSLKQKYNIYMPKASAPIITPTQEQQEIKVNDKVMQPIVSRSLSNSRKASQVNINVVASINNQQVLKQTRTAQMKYRYKNQLNTLPIEEEKAVVAQKMIANQIATINRQNTVLPDLNQKYLLMKKTTESAKKQKLPFQFVLHQRGVSLSNNN